MTIYVPLLCLLNIISLRHNNGFTTSNIRLASNQRKQTHLWSDWNNFGSNDRKDFSSGDRRSSSRGGRYGGGGSGRGRGRGRYDSRPRQDPYEKLRFSKTIKIDPDLKTSIDDMNFSPNTLRVLKEKGFEYMTPVQSQSYEHVASGADVVARSRTGTGKTFAFGLPLIENLVSSRQSELRGGENLPLILVLEPTRELAMQVADELNSICAAHRMKVLAVYGGSSYNMQERAIRAGVHILVATPGRALDHISRGSVDLSRVKHVVLDEGDTMLEMGFQKNVETIIANVRTPGERARRAAQESLSDEDDDVTVGSKGSWSPTRSRLSSSPESEDDLNVYADEGDDDSNDEVESERPVQMLLFSATMPGWICSLTDKHMIDPIFLDAVQEGETRLATTIEHLAIRLPSVYDRLAAVTAFVEDVILTKGKGGQTIVFTNTREEANQLTSSDCFGQLRSQVIHGDIGQDSRQATLKMFKEGSLEVLVATDVAARGLDIAGVDLVVHTCPPNDEDTYVHRSGRTGRAGRNGTSVVLFASGEERKLSMFERTLNFRFVKAGPPSPSEISEACGLLAAKRLQKVSPDIVRHFYPVARRMIEDKSYLQDPESTAGGEIVSPLLSEAMREGATTSAPVARDMTELLARCLAAMSNRKSITCRCG